MSVPRMIPYQLRAAIEPVHLHCSNGGRHLQCLPSLGAIARVDGIAGTPVAVLGSTCGQGSGGVTLTTDGGCHLLRRPVVSGMFVRTRPWNPRLPVRNPGRENARVVA